MKPPVRSYLYVPGDDGRRIEKAFASEADAVVLDLEDAVAPNLKEEARETVARVLESEPEKPVFVRVNAVGTELWAADIDAVAVHNLAGLRLPKTESVESVRLVAQTLEELGSEARIQCLIESALGLERVFEIATSHERVAGISIGEADLSADLGVGDETGLLYARSRIVSASRAAGLPHPVQSVYTLVHDLEGLRRSTEAKKLGFVGRSTIHPSQVPVVNDVFTPTEQEVSEAEGLLGRLGNEEGAFVLEDGRFVDRAVVESARLTLGLARGGSALRNGLLDAIEGGIEVYDLAQPLAAETPHSPNHPPFRMALIRRHGDMVRADGSSAASELISTGGHTGTHVDALAHVSYMGHLHGGAPADEAQQGGRFSLLGVDTIEPLVCRGVLLDVAGLRGVDVLPGGYGITAEDLASAEREAGVEVRAGDVALIRSGWAQHFGDAGVFLGHESGVPGPTEEAAGWLASRGVRATGAETIAYEQIKPEVGHALLPVHRLLLAEHGIHIIEVMNLSGLAAAGMHEFVFVLAPLKIVGGTGSPVRPLALAQR